MLHKTHHCWLKVSACLVSHSCISEPSVVEYATQFQFIVLYAASLAIKIVTKRC